MDEMYYTLDPGSMGFRPNLTWCFLAEIVDVIPWPIRPMLNVKDREGRVSLLAFHLEGLEWHMFQKIREKYKKGYTVAVMHAEAHFFMDGQMGLRIRSMRDVHVWIILNLLYVLGEYHTDALYLAYSGPLWAFAEARGTVESSQKRVSAMRGIGLSQVQILHC
jgi:hypothetical protein